MTGTRQRATLGLAVLTCFGVMSSRAWADTPDFRTIRDAWRELERTSFSPTLMETTEVTDPGAALSNQYPVLTQRRRVGLSHDTIWFQNWSHSGDQKVSTLQSVIAANSQYRFELTQSPTAREPGPVMTSIMFQPETPDNSVDYLLHSAIARTLLSVRFAYIPDLIDQRELEVHDVAISRDGLVDLRLVSRQPIAGDSNSSIANVTLRLDPDAHYAIVNAVHTSKPDWPDSAGETRNTLRIDAQGRVVPVTSLERYTKPGSTRQVTFDRFEFTMPETAPAWLSHYGLPEPKPPQSPGSYRLPAWMYLVVGSVLAIVAGFGILYLAKRPRP